MKQNIISPFVDHEPSGDIFGFYQTGFGFHRSAGGIPSDILISQVSQRSNLRIERYLKSAQKLP